MKNLLYKITSFFWRNPYLKFKHTPEKCIMQIYWPLMKDEKDLNAFCALSANVGLIHSSYSTGLKQTLRNTIVEFGQKHNQYVSAYTMLNMIDGMDFGEAMTYAQQRIYNHNPPACKIITEENDEQDRENDDSKSGVTYLHPSAFYAFHHSREHL